jgi:FkbM family methyltransferase
MRRAITGILKAFGLYKPLLKQKQKLDQRKAELMEEENHRRRLAFYSTFISKGQLVFDVGANIGNRTANFLEIGANVIAVEPQPDCIRILAAKFGNRITIEPVGLASQPGEMEMYIADESTISTFSKDFIDKTKDNKFRRNSWEKKINVKIITIDELIRNHGIPDFCKMDVEGFETEVLKGLSTPLPKLSFEYNVPEMAENIYQNVMLLGKLSPDYFYNYCIGESMKLELSEWKNATDFMKIAKSPAFLDSDFGDIYAFIKSPNPAS